MRKQKVKHSKVRNTGLLFEFLLRQITADVLNKKGDNAVHIVKEHFNEQSCLGRELSLYNILTQQKFKSDKQAEYFVNEVLNNRKKINNSILRREKYNLIKKLKESYNLQNFLSSKVINYKLYASIYKLFEYTSNLSPEEKTESFFNLVEHITTKSKGINLSESIGGAKLPKDEDLRILTYKTLLERFNQKYTKLNNPQKSLLRAYINNVSNTNSLKEYIQKIKPAIESELKKYSKNLSDDVVKIKLAEAINSMDKFCGVGKSNNIKDSVVVQTMRYLELLKELKKSGNKDKKTL